MHEVQHSCRKLISDSGSSWLNQCLAWAKPHNCKWRLYPETPRGGQKCITGKPFEAQPSSHQGLANFCVKDRERAFDQCDGLLDGFWNEAVFAQTPDRSAGSSLRALADQTDRQIRADRRLREASAIPTKMLKDGFDVLWVLFHARDRAPQRIIKASRHLVSETSYH
jgi:hypothetical protein